MSTAKTRGKGSPLYLPESLDADFKPSGEEIEFATRFRELAEVIEECPSSELVALLLSTCRNQWMTVNGAFVDLQEILGAGRLPDLASRGFHDLREERWAASAKSFRKALELRSALVQKLTCWEKRDELLAQVTAAIGSQDDPLLRDRMQAWLARQSHGPSTPGRIRQSHYLALDTTEATSCAEPIDLITRSAAKLEPVLRISHRIARLMAAASDSAEAGPVVVEDPPQPLFELDSAESMDSDEESDTRAEREKDLAKVWGELRRLVHDQAEALGISVRGEVDQPISIAFEGTGTFDIPHDPPLEAQLLEPAAGPAAALGLLSSRAEEVADYVRSEVLEAFIPNVAAPPMPAPFVVDLTPRELASDGGRIRSFTVQRVDGLRDPIPDVSKLALLCCGMPSSAYTGTNKNHLAYSLDKKEGARKAKQVAMAAIEAAAEQGASFLAMPEVFLPRSAVQPVLDAANSANVGLITGLEYPENRGGPINEALIQIPGLYEPIRQRKQGPSVEEINHAGFESTLELFFLRRTDLGNVGVIICSDYLELDLVWALASFDERLDLLIICARNYNHEVFEQIAIADALRLHAYIAVVNSWAPREGDTELPSGRGTLVSGPNSESGLLDLESIPLPVDWENEIENPTLSIASLDIVKLRSRDQERPGAHGYVHPPRFAQYRPGS